MRKQQEESVDGYTWGGNGVDREREWMCDLCRRTNLHDVMCPAFLFDDDGYEVVDNDCDAIDFMDRRICKETD